MHLISYISQFKANELICLHFNSIVRIFKVVHLLNAFKLNIMMVTVLVSWLFKMVNNIGTSQTTMEGGSTYSVSKCKYHQYQFHQIFYNFNIILLVFKPQTNTKISHIYISNLTFNILRIFNIQYIKKFQCCPSVKNNNGKSLNNISIDTIKNFIWKSRMKKYHSAAACNMPSEMILEPDRRVPSPILHDQVCGKLEYGEKEKKILNSVLAKSENLKLTQEKGTCCFLGCSGQYDHFLWNLKSGNKTVIVIWL